jgi:hypothetical protein
MVTKEKNIKVRRPTNISSFLGNMGMWSPNVLRIWNL